MAALSPLSEGQFERFEVMQHALAELVKHDRRALFGCGMRRQPAFVCEALE